MCLIENQKKCSLGDYYIGKVDSVIICGPMLMHYGEGYKYFSDPEVYNPNRYLNDKNKWQYLVLLSEAKFFEKEYLVINFLFL